MMSGLFADADWGTMSHPVFLSLFRHQIIVTQRPFPAETRTLDNRLAGSTLKVNDCAHFSAAEGRRRYRPAGLTRASNGSSVLSANCRGTLPFLAFLS